MANRRETKDLKFMIEQMDEDRGTFTGYASVWDVVDGDDEMVVKGAFKKTIKEKKAFPMLWSHDPGEPIGIIVPVEDELGLRVSGSLNLDVQRARETRSLMRQMSDAGTPMGLSIGYNVVKEENDKDTGIRKLKEIRLWEISPVVFPACDPARVDDIKAEDGAGDAAPEALPGNEPAVEATSDQKPPEDMGEGVLIQALDLLRAGYAQARENLRKE